MTFSFMAVCDFHLPFRIPFFSTRFTCSKSDRNLVFGYRAEACVVITAACPKSRMGFSCVISQPVATGIGATLPRDINGCCLIRLLLATGCCVIGLLVTAGCGVIGLLVATSCGVIGLLVATSCGVIGLLVATSCGVIGM